VYSDLLLSPGVERLISASDEFCLKGVAIKDKQVLSEEIHHFQPDMVIMDESSSFTAPSTIIEMLKNRPQMRLIVIKIRDNQLQVYNRVEFSVSCFEDLLSIIRDS
jgi:hypothetical protein